MESSLYRKEALPGGPAKKAGPARLINPAPVYPLIVILLVVLIAGMVLSLLYSHEYEKRSIGFVVPAQSEFSPGRSDERGPFDAYIFVAEDSIEHLSVGQAIEIRFAERAYAQLPPFPSRIENIISPDELAGNSGQDAQSQNSNHMIIASLPGSAVELDVNNRQELRPGMALHVNFFTEQVSWFELLLQPLKNLTDPL